MDIKSIKIKGRTITNDAYSVGGNLVPLFMLSLSTAKMIKEATYSAMQQCARDEYYPEERQWRKEYYNLEKFVDSYSKISNQINKVNTL